MKKVYLLFLIPFLASQVTRAQNIGIGTLTPVYKLTDQKPKSAGNWGLMHSDSIVSVGDDISSTGEEQQTTIKEQNEKIAGLSAKVEVLIQAIEKLTHK